MLISFIALSSSYKIGLKAIISSASRLEGQSGLFAGEKAKTSGF